LEEESFIFNDTTERYIDLSVCTYINLEPTFVIMYRDLEPTFVIMYIDLEPTFVIMYIDLEPTFVIMYGETDEDPSDKKVCAQMSHSPKTKRPNIEAKRDLVRDTGIRRSL
jgi:hypothetical protein